MVNRTQFIELANNLYDAEVNASHSAIHQGNPNQSEDLRKAMNCRNALIAMINEMRINFVFD